MNPVWPSISVALLVLLVACGHTEPLPTGARGGDEPFDPSSPVRLTYSDGDDAWPMLSRDGQTISYRFARGTADRDFCAGVLPATGGQRIEEICAWEANERNRSEDFRAMVLLGTDRMAFTRHASGTGNQSPSEAGLFLAPLGREREAVRVLDLFARPAGASDVWSYLIDPVWLGGDELMVLATRAFIGQLFPFGPVDTVHLGVEIARIDVGTAPATITPLAQAPDAIAWALDEGAGMLYYHRRYYTAPPGTGTSAVAADTIFRVPLAGGAAEPIYGRPPVPDAVSSGMEGMAAAGGRVFVTLWEEVSVPAVPQPVLESRHRIALVSGPGTGTIIGSRTGPAGSRWTRLSASPDGRHLVVGSILGGQRDLYRLTAE